VRSAEGSVVGLIYGACAVGIEEAVREDLVVIGRVGRGLDRKRRRSALDTGTIDAATAVKERHARTAEGETACQSADVGNVLAELSGEDRDVRHARGADVLVSQFQPILGTSEVGPWLARTTSSTRRSPRSDPRDPTDMAALAAVRSAGTSRPQRSHRGHPPRECRRRDWDRNSADRGRLRACSARVRAGSHTRFYVP
jgi:hypothetical protein